VALCWVLHLVGDVHQPLHCAALYSADYQEGDAGGNLFGLKVDGRARVLHAYWDDLLGEVPGPYDDTPRRAAKVYDLAVRAAESLRDPKYSRDSLKDQLAEDRTFPRWAQRSHELARTVAYKDGEEDLAGVKIPGGNVPADAPAASKGYAERARAVASRQAALAGYRLADKLRALLQG
jgi:hypothetical protein